MLSVYQYYSRFRYKLEGLQLSIFDNRILPRHEPALTLEALGQREALTRERIRQIERPVREQFDEGLKTCNTDSLRRLLDKSKETASPVPVEDFLRAAGWPFIPSGEDELPNSIASFLELGEVRGRHVFAGSFHEFCKIAANQYREHKQVSPETEIDWKDFETFLVDDLWGPGLTSVLDLREVRKASGAGKPLGATQQIRKYLMERPGQSYSLESLITKLNLGSASKRGLASALAGSEISRGLDGGYVYFPGQKQELTSTKDLISKFLISKPNQSASFEEVFEYVRSARPLSRPAIKAACKKFPIQTVNGTVSFTDAGRKVRKSPFHTKGLFFDPHKNVWRLRLQIGEEALRGLPVRLPVALVSSLRLGGGKNTFTVLPLNLEGSANWNSVQLMFSSLRRSLLELSVKPGETVFLEFDDSRKLTISRCKPLTSKPGLGRVKEYAGFEVDEDDGTIVQAFGLKTLGLTLEEALRGRGELDLLF